MKTKRDEITPTVLISVVLLAVVPLLLFTCIAKRVVTLLERRKDGRDMDRNEERYLSCAPNYGASAAATATCNNPGPVNKVGFEHLRDLVEGLSHEEDEEDRPSDYSVKAFEQLISKTCERLGGAISRPVVVPDSEHGIRIAWKNAEREVRVMLPESQNRRAYIYFRNGNHSEVDETLSADLLATRLEALS